MDSELQELGLQTPELRDQFIRRNWTVVQRALSLEKARKAYYAGYVIATGLAILVGIYGLACGEGLNIDHYIFFLNAAFYFRRCSIRVKISPQTLDLKRTYTRVLVGVSLRCLVGSVMFYTVATLPLHLRWFSGFGCFVWLTIQLAIVLIDGMDV